MNYSTDNPSVLVVKGQDLGLPKVLDLLQQVNLRGVAHITAENEGEAVALLHHGVFDQAIRGGLIRGPEYEQFRQDLLELARS